MEDKHREEMEGERKRAMAGQETEMKQKMDEVSKEYKSDVDLLLKERELMVEQAEGSYFYYFSSNRIIDYCKHFDACNFNYYAFHISHPCTGL